MVKFRALSVRPGLEYTSWSSRRYPSCCRVALSIRELLSDGVLVVSSWYLGSLLKRAPTFLEGLLRDGERCPWKSFPFILVSSFLDEEFLVGLSSLLFNCLFFFFFVFPLVLLSSRG